MTADLPIIVDLFACGWGIACRDCENEPHDCEECLAWAYCKQPVAALKVMEECK